MLEGVRMKGEKRKGALVEWVVNGNVRKVEGDEYEEQIGGENEEMSGIEFRHNLSALKV